MAWYTLQQIKEDGFRVIGTGESDIYPEGLNGGIVDKFTSEHMNAECWVSEGSNVTNSILENAIINYSTISDSKIYDSRVMESTIENTTITQDSHLFNCKCEFAYIESTSIGRSGVKFINLIKSLVHGSKINYWDKKPLSMIEHSHISRSEIQNSVLEINNKCDNVGVHIENSNICLGYIDMPKGTSCYGFNIYAPTLKSLDFNKGITTISYSTIHPFSIGCTKNNVLIICNEEFVIKGKFRINVKLKTSLPSHLYKAVIGLIREVYGADLSKI